jgi:RNA polymerase sigma-70 factor (ECF subfamily)
MFEAPIGTRSSILAIHIGGIRTHTPLDALNPSLHRLIGVCFGAMGDRAHTRSEERDKFSEGTTAALELDRSFRGPLVAYFLKRVKSRNEAEDLTQEVFVRLLNHPDKNNGLTIEGYVFTIAANLLRDRAKSVAAAAQKRAHSLNVLDEKDAFNANLIEDRHPERVLVGRQTIQDVLEALAELGERTRDVFILARLENMQHREIATMYGVSVSAVEKMMMKAMAHLGARFL